MLSPLSGLRLLGTWKFLKKKSKSRVSTSSLKKFDVFKKKVKVHIKAGWRRVVGCRYLPTVVSVLRPALRLAYQYFGFE